MKKKRVKKRASRFDWQWVWWGAAFVLFVAIVLFGFWFIGESTRRPSEVSRPVTAARPAGLPVKLYYYNEKADRIMPVERVIPETRPPIQETISLLIKGELTAEERAAGFSTEFPNPGFKLLRADLNRGVLTLEFSDVPGFTTGGAMRVELLATQIERTAKQFPGVREVRFLPETMFQP